MGPVSDSNQNEAFGMTLIGCDTLPIVPLMAVHHLSAERRDMGMASTETHEMEHCQGLYGTTWHCTEDRAFGSLFCRLSWKTNGVTCTPPLRIYL